MDKTKCVGCICTDCVRDCDKCQACDGTHKMGECYGYAKEFLICEGCKKKIFVGDEIIDLELNEENQGITIHKNLDCLLKLDGVCHGAVTDIRTVKPGDLFSSYGPKIKRIK